MIILAPLSPKKGEGSQVVYYFANYHLNQNLNQNPEEPTMPWRDELGSEHENRKRDQLWRQRSAITSPQGVQVSVDGKQFLNFCSNDYLGLANHPDVIAAAVTATQQRGTGSGASHLVCGHSDGHHQLEQQIADFVGAEQAILFSTGYMANLAIPQTFLGRDDLIAQDRLNHASLIDGGRYCEAKMKRYPHCDAAAADKLLADSNAPRKLVTTDGVFSMDGTIAPVKELKTICDDRQAMLVVDDAHGFGALGARGIGTLESAELKVGGNVLMVGTLGKSAGSFGAFVAGDEVYIETLVQHARAYIYTTALPPCVVAATSAAIKIIANEPQRREKLNNNIAQFRESCQASSVRLADSHTPIQPILLGSAAAALKASLFLKSNGVWVTAIRPPTVPAGSARLRITLSSDHQREHIARLTELLSSDVMTRILGESNEETA